MRGMRARVILGTLVAALAPVLAVGWFARSNIVESTRQEHARRMDRAVSAASHRVDERIDEDRRAIDRLCERDFVIDHLLLDVASDRFDDSRQRELGELLPPLMRSLGLDVLYLLDGRPEHVGEVLGAGHLPSLGGARAPVLAEEAQDAAERPFLTEVRVARGDGHADVRALLAACVADRSNMQLWVVGGRVLSSSYVADLASGSHDVEMVLSEGVAEPDSADQRLVHAFDDAEGEPAAHLVALLDDSALETQLASLDRGLLFAGLFAVFLALLVGGASAIWLSRPLAELEEATRRVGAGDLTATVTVRSGGEVGKALGAFNDMTRELRRTQRKLLRAERIAAWRDIARRIAHEIKNPLSPIQISIETMRKTYKKQHPDFPEIFEESTLTILEEVERLRRIVTEFSQFARMPRPRSDVLNVVEIVSHVVSLHRDEGVSFEVKGKVGEIKGDRDQLTQVLENLVKNAIEASGGGGEEGGTAGPVKVIVEPWGEGASIRIQDSGPGIPEEERLRIFEPYYTTKAGGTGLGLAIVHRIVGDHGGSVEIGDAPGGGAELLVQLPAEGPPPEASASMTGTAMPLIRKK